MATLTDAQRAAGWKIVKLGDATTKIGSGSTPRGGKSAYTENGAILIRSQNVLDNKLDFMDAVHISAEAEQKLKSVKVYIGDVLLNITGSGNTTIGRSAYVKNLPEVAYVNQHVSIIRADSEKINPIYLQKYLMAFKELLLSLSYGSTRDALTKGIIEDFEVILPPMEEQDRIASILGSLDDKIEANTHLIQLLEETTKALVREDKSIVTCKISDKLIQSTRQELPITATSDMVYHYSLPAYDCGKTPKLEDSKSIKSNKFLVTEPCLLLSKLNPRTPRIWCVYPKKGYKNYASTEFVVFVPKKHEELAALWVSCSEGSLYKDLEGMAGGTSASHQRVKPVDILMQDISVPKNINIYNSYVSQIESLYSENVHLSTIRDLLIKKLIG